MQLIPTELEDLFIIQPQVFQDERGCFFESFNARDMVRSNLNYHFVQDNSSESSYGVIRGLHFQTGKMSQAKLVRVSYGEALDVVVDLRPASKTFGKSFSILLSKENKKQLLIPRGFAHGYSVLSKECVFSYKCDNYYSKLFESGIHPNDPSLNIDWRIPKEFQIISIKDLQLPYFNAIDIKKA